MPSERLPGGAAEGNAAGRLLEEGVQLEQRNQNEQPFGHPGVGNLKELA